MECLEDPLELLIVVRVGGMKILIILLEKFLPTINRNIIIVQDVEKK